MKYETSDYSLAEIFYIKNGHAEDITRGTLHKASLTEDYVATAMQWYVSKKMGLFSVDSQKALCVAKSGIGSSSQWHCFCVA